MNNKEFSNNFDLLLNSYNPSGSSIEIDEFEKSELLTLAQNQIITELYNGNNIFGASFEETEELRTYLRDLILTCKPNKITEDIKGLTKASAFYEIPKDLLFITYESIVFDSDNSCIKNSIIEVLPVRQDEFHSIRNNPFKNANKRRVLRLDNAKTIELISAFPIKEYLIRYIRKPSPIILLDIHGEELTIEGKNKESECELNPILHRYILERAVDLALITRGIRRG